MLNYLSTRKEAFSPEEIAALVGAFEQAWQSVLSSTHDVDDEAVRELLAKHIVETAIKGELDNDQLARDALDHLATTLLDAPRQPPTSIEEPPRFEREYLGSMSV
jgi:hypothetical protein